MNEKEKKFKKLYLVDGSSYIFRAYHATERQRLSTSKGLPTGASYVFTNMLQKLVREEKPDYLVVIWDAEGKTFREDSYPAYKANRKEVPDDLIPQFDYIRKIVSAYRIPTLEFSGYEADDVIASIVESLKKEQELKIVIVSGDKDMAQLVDKNVIILDTMKERVLDEEAVKERFGVSPEKIVDLFALMGDTIDNIPGVIGIGEKTARSLMNDFQSLEEIYRNLEKLPEKLKSKLEKYKDDAFLSRELVRLRKDLKLDFNLEDWAIKEPDSEKLTSLFRELEFNKLLSEYSQESFKLDRESYKLVVEEEELDALISELARAGIFALDTETTSKDPMRANLVGISFCLGEKRAFYVPVGHKVNLGEKQLDKSLVLKKLKPVLEDPSIKKVGQNIKYDYIVLFREGIKVRGIHFDTMIASYVLNPRRKTHNLDELALEHLGHKKISYEELAGKGRKERCFSEVCLKDACMYSAEDAEASYLLFKKFAPEIEKSNLNSVFFGLEIPLIEVLARMEMNGVKVDEKRLKELSEDFLRREEEIKKKIFELAGTEFNPDSPKQLQEVLFKKLGLPTKKKTKTGFSTGVEVLEELSLIHPLPEAILEYRSLSKLRSTYTDALVSALNPETRRLHTSYNQAITATGRLSSSEPNLQNIPARSEEGKRIREAFVAEEGYLLLSADYSQIELRILSHFSEEPALIDAFQRGEDIHKRTASEVFGVAPEDVNDEMRRKAKVINFGVLYGMSDFGLAQELKIDQKEAGRYIDAYFSRYPRVRSYLESILEKARRDLYITTLLGRRCHFPDINSSNQYIRKSAEREAINAPMQGSAADIIKLAMVKIHKVIEKENLKTKMILQVHDELVFEVPEDELSRVKVIVKEEMENVVKLRVSLKVDIGVGKNWAMAH